MVWHGSRVDPASPTPGDEVTFTVTVGADVSAEAVDLMLLRGDADSNEVESHPMRLVKTTWSEVSGGYTETWQCTIAAEHDELWRYRIRCQTPNHEVVWADTNSITEEPAEFAVSVDNHHRPSWLNDAVIYELDIDQFFPSTSPDQLNSADIGDALDHIDRLGANVIWVNTTPAGTAIESWNALDLLIADAHSRRFRVLTSFGDSEISESGENAAVAMVDRGVDGFVLQAETVSAIPEFLSLRRTLRQNSSDFAFIATGVASPGRHHRMANFVDGILDESFANHARDYIGRESSSADDFWRFLDRHRRWTSSGPLPITMLDPSGEDRFLALVSGDTRRFNIAILLQMSLPHPASLVYGSELGVRSNHRVAPIAWGSSIDKELLEYVRSVIFWRKKFGLSHASPRLVHAGSDGTLIFTTDSWLIAINRNEEETVIDLGSYGSMWLSLATENDVKLYGSELVLPPQSGAVLANELAR